MVATSLARIRVFEVSLMAVLPTIEKRSEVLDVARGVAVLGIFLANLAAFCSPISEMFVPTVRTEFNSFFEAFCVAFVNGKFRTMLAILFGVGLYLQFQKRGHDPNLWPGGYLKRSLVLLLLGTCHMLFIWFGDILALYAITAFIVALMVNIPDEAIVKILWVGFALSTMCGVCLGIGMGFIPKDQSSTEFAREIAIFGSGTYLEQLAYRATNHMPFMAMQNSMMVFVTVPLFLLGVLLARRGVLMEPSKFPVERRWMLWVGFGVGLPFNVVAAGLSLSNPSGGPQMFVEFASGPLQGVGYLMLLAIIVEKLRHAKFWNPVRNVGRMALTVYLTQSLVATFLFYSWGLGWFYTQDPSKLLGSIAIVWTVSLLLPALWLRRFDIGPVEWLLRSLTEGKRLPWRYRNSSG
jgi:uncharacterized protein